MTPVRGSAPGRRGGVGLGASTCRSIQLLILYEDTSTVVLLSTPPRAMATPSRVSVATARGQSARQRRALRQPRLSVPVSGGIEEVARPGQAAPTTYAEGGGLPFAWTPSLSGERHSEENPSVRRGLTREATRRAPSERPVRGTHRDGAYREISVPSASECWRGTSHAPAARTCSLCSVGGSRVRPALDTHGRVLGQLERLGRPLGDLLPARRAFETRDLAVFVVSTGASRRHGLSLVAAVRGRTLRWFRHGYLPCYARVSIRSRAPALGPQPSRHPDVSHPTGRAEPSKSAEKPTHPSPSSLTTEQPHHAWVRGQGGLRLSVRVLRAIPPPMVSRRRASWRVAGVVRRHEASPAGAPECGSLATPLMDANARWARQPGLQQVAVQVAVAHHHQSQPIVFHHECRGEESPLQDWRLVRLTTTA